MRNGWDDCIAATAPTWKEASALRELREGTDQLTGALLGAQPTADTRPQQTKVRGPPASDDADRCRRRERASAQPQLAAGP
jgi:hypothetical protein